MLQCALSSLAVLRRRGAAGRCPPRRKLAAATGIAGRRGGVGAGIRALVAACGCVSSSSLAGVAGGGGGAVARVLGGVVWRAVVIGVFAVPVAWGRGICWRAAWGK